MKGRQKCLPFLLYNQIMRKYSVYYSGSPNFGDAINPILYKKITGEDCQWSPPEASGKILACGSIAHEARPYDILWGTGCLSPDIPLKCDVTTQVLAARGPLSAELLHKQTKSHIDIYGDPGLLLSEYILPNDERNRVGIIPHYVDRDLVTSDPSINKYYIDIMSGVDNVISCVTKCHYIITSALHGLICAESFGIPAIWVEFSDNVAGNGFKFKDYYLGTYRQPRTPLDWRGKRDINEAIQIIKYSWEPPEVDVDLLLSACPFEWGVTDYKRWDALGEHWGERNETIARIVDENSNVLEFGAGKQVLRDMLKSCSYTPSDIRKYTEDTIVCDLNTGIYPDLSYYDTIIMSGVLEYVYLENIKRLLKYVKNFTNIKTFICSYEHGGHQDMRSFNGWVNDISKEDLIIMFCKEGFELEKDYGNIYKFT